MELERTGNRRRQIQRPAPILQLHRFRQERLPVFNQIQIHCAARFIGQHRDGHDVADFIQRFIGAQKYLFGARLCGKLEFFRGRIARTVFRLKVHVQRWPRRGEAKFANPRRIGRKRQFLLTHPFPLLGGELSF